jgi:isopenicillin-N epimerase
MAAVPLPRQLDGADAQRVRDALWFEHGIEIAVLARDGTLSARVSAQVYNDDDDLERLADAVDALARR